MSAASDFDIKDLQLAGAGLARIDWAFAQMPVLQQLCSCFENTQPLKGVRVSGCLHITTETANLARCLRAGGADVVLCASNPLSTQDDVAAALVKHFAIPVYAIRGEGRDTYYQHIDAVIAHCPVLTLDDGADLVGTLHRTESPLLKDMQGGTEETTTGVIRLRAMAADGALKFPVIAVNDANSKHLFDNRYGTGQSALDGIIRATNCLIAGSTFVVIGYGWCGKGLAMRAKGHGAMVVVCEVDPMRALEAAMDGFTVMPSVAAAQEADFMVTLTGDKHVIDRQHFDVMKDGCIIANSGHFDVEINVAVLEGMASGISYPRSEVAEYAMQDGRTVRLLCRGRLVNLAAAEGHPASVMDMSFSNQALSLVYLKDHHGQLSNAVHGVPAAIDSQVASMKLAAMGMSIDALTAEQSQYLRCWHQGT